MPGLFDKACLLDSAFVFIILLLPAIYESPIAPHPYQYLVLSVFFILAILVILICISHMKSVAETFSCDYSSVYLLW